MTSNNECETCNGVGHVAEEVYVTGQGTFHALVVCPRCDAMKQSAEVKCVWCRGEPAGANGFCSDACLEECDEAHAAWTAARGVV